MEKTRVYNIEGAVLEIPLRYDEQSGMYIEVYPDFAEQPVYTPEGNPILFTGEDACRYGEAADGAACVDCGSCRFYRQTPGTWIGVCGREEKRKKRKQTGRGGGQPPAPAGSAKEPGTPNKGGCT